MAEGGSGRDSEGTSQLHRVEGEVPCVRYIRFGHRELGATGEVEAQEIWSPIFGEEEVVDFLDTENIKGWVCAVFVCSDGRSGNIIESCAPVAEVIQSLEGIQRYVLVGERNAKHVWHVHALLETIRRTDSLRRSIIKTANQKQGVIWATNKLAVVHSFKAIFCYMLKDPCEIESNDSLMLQMASDAMYYGMSVKYKLPKTERKQWSAHKEVREITCDVLKIIDDNNCKNRDDVFRCGSDVLGKYLHIPMLGHIIQNCLDLICGSGRSWCVKNCNKYLPHAWLIHEILKRQNIDVNWFDSMFWKWINKNNGKKNTILLYGPSNTGKSAFIAGLKALMIPYGEIQNTNSGFAFEALAGAQLGVWEEPLISPELAEKVKIIFEGMPTMIPIKYKKPLQIPQIPIIVTSNHWPWRYCSAEEVAFRNRLEILYFCNPAPSECSCDLERDIRQGDQSIGSIRETVADEQGYIPAGEQLKRKASVCSSGSEHSRKFFATDPRSSESSSTETCRSDSREHSYSKRSSGIECSDSAGHSSSSSSSISDDRGPSWNNRSGYTGVRIYGTGTILGEPLHRLCRTDSGIGVVDSSGRRVLRTVDARNYRGTGSILPGEQGIYALGEGPGQLSNRREIKGEQKVGGKVCSCLRVPSKEDWGSYVSYLIAQNDRI